MGKSTSARCKVSGVPNRRPPHQRTRAHAHTHTQTHAHKRMHACAPVHVRQIFEFKANNDHLMHAPYEYFRKILAAQINQVLVGDHWMDNELTARLKSLGEISLVPVLLSILILGSWIV